MLIFGAAASRLVEFAVELALALLLLIAIHHGGVPASMVLLPLLVVLQVLLAVGLVMMIATLAVFYHDVQHALPIVVLILFYVSPVFYPASLVPAAFQRAYLFNPIAGLLTLYHVTLYEGRFPPATLLAGVTVAAVAVCLAGYGIFNRFKPLFAEIV